MNATREALRYVHARLEALLDEPRSLDYLRSELRDLRDRAADAIQEADLEDELVDLGPELQPPAGS